MVIKGIIRNLCTEAEAKSRVLLQVPSLYPTASHTSKDSMPLIQNFLSSHLQNGIDVFKNLNLPALKIHDIIQQMMIFCCLLVMTTKQITGHASDRPHVVVILTEGTRGGQEPGRGRWETASSPQCTSASRWTAGRSDPSEHKREDMTTKMQSVPPPSLQLHPRATMGLDMFWAPSLLLDPSFHTSLIPK